MAISVTHLAWLDQSQSAYSSTAVPSCDHNKDDHLFAQTMPPIVPPAATSITIDHLL